MILAHLDMAETYIIHAEPHGLTCIAGTPLVNRRRNRFLLAIALPNRIHELLRDRDGRAIIDIGTARRHGTGAVKTRWRSVSSISIPWRPGHGPSGSDPCGFCEPLRAL